MSRRGLRARGAGDPASVALPATGPRVGAWMAAVVLGLGLVSVALLFATRWIDRELIRRDEALLHAIDEVRIAVASSHLWLEEYVSGDHVTPGEIERHHDEAWRLLTSMLREPSAPDATVPALRAESFRRRAEALAERLHRFREITEIRQRGTATGGDVGIGSALDVEYDRVFGELLAEAELLSEALETRLAANRGRANDLFLAIAGAWTLIIGLTVAGMWTLTRRRAAAEAALWESRRRLAQSQKMEAVGGLAGGVAHDLNNYLGAIRGHAELLAPAPGDRPRVESILRVVDKASALIDRLLAFARRQPAAARTIDPGRALEEGLGPLVDRLLGKEVALEIAWGHGAWTVTIDPAELEQVVLNLLLNARDAMPGGGRLRLASAAHALGAAEAGAAGLPAPGEFVAIAVSDTGDGIPEELHERIFEPFFTTKERAGNSGLGLATAFGIVRAAGGAIELESAPGRGSTFTVWLPRGAGEPEPAGEPSIPAGSRPRATTGRQDPAPAASTRQRARGLSILIVDDDEELLASTASMLAAAGHEVDSAPHGPGALALLEPRRGERRPYDLLITDVIMPGMPGTRLAAQVLERHPEVRVLYVSGYTEDPGAAAPLLRKPFSMEGLLDAVDRATAEPTPQRGAT